MSLGDKIRAVAEFNDRPMVALAREADALELELETARNDSARNNEYLLGQVALWRGRVEKALEVEPHENYPGQEALNDWDNGFNWAISLVREALEEKK